MVEKRKMIKRFYFPNGVQDIELPITKEMRPCRECGGIGQAIRLQYRDLKFVRCKKCGKRTRMFEYFRQAITAWVLGDIFKPDIMEDKGGCK